MKTQEYKELAHKSIKAFGGKACAVNSYGCYHEILVFAEEPVCIGHEWVGNVLGKHSIKEYSGPENSLIVLEAPKELEITGEIETFEQISRRDYFAGLAMQAIITTDINQNFSEEKVAQRSYAQADAMLERQIKPQK